MNIEELRNYCIAKPGSTEEFPFDESTLVFKVMGKMFALTGLNKEYCAVNLKCDPDKAIELRETYPEITAGFHMSKKHWNTVQCEEDLNENLIRELIDHSYELVVSKLTKKIKLELIDLGYKTC